MSTTNTESSRDRLEHIIHAIENRKVVFLVGAGISRATPTNLETAKELSQKFSERFKQYNWWRTYFNPENLSEEQKTERLYDISDGLPRLEEIAELFLERGEFKLFIDSLDPRIWEVKPANVCHEVICEFLIEVVCTGIITTNLDNRIEKKHRDLHPSRGPCVISHDDFFNQRGQNNNIFKIHGCLYKDNAKKYETIWTSSQLKSSNWPKGVKFADNVIKQYGADHVFIFVGLSTFPGYLEKTIAEINKAKESRNQASLECYCVVPESFETILDDEQKRKFISVINLDEKAHYQMVGEDFFCILRQISFEILLEELFRNNPLLEGSNFKGGSTECLQIDKRHFDRIKEILKSEIVKTDRTKFQRFLRLTVFDKSHEKYVSFRFDIDKMARLFLLLILLRFNYSLIFGENPFRHLIISKDDGFETYLIIRNGAGRYPLSKILQDINKELSQDKEMAHDMKNVFVYDAAAIDCVYSKPQVFGTGRIIERDSEKITNGYAVNYCVLTQYDLYNLLKESDIRQYCKRLDSVPWIVK